MVQHLAPGKVSSQSLAARTDSLLTPRSTTRHPARVFLASLPARRLEISPRTAREYTFYPVRKVHNFVVAVQAVIIPLPKRTFNAERGALSAHVVEEARRLHPDLISFHFSATLEARLCPSLKTFVHAPAYLARLTRGQ